MEVNLFLESGYQGTHWCLTVIWFVIAGKGNVFWSGLDITRTVNLRYNSIKCVKYGFSYFTWRRTGEWSRASCRRLRTLWVATSLDSWPHVVTRRLEAEAIRDALLQAAGTLDRERPVGSPVGMVAGVLTAGLCLTWVSRSGTWRLLCRGWGGGVPVSLSRPPAWPLTLVRWPGPWSARLVTTFSTASWTHPSIEADSYLVSMMSVTPRVRSLWPV